MPSQNKLNVTAEPGKQDVIITREFDAPRDLVYKAHTDPKLYVQWLGPRGYEMVLDVFEPHSGGRYRYIHKDQNGNEFGFHGVFHEISDDLMIQTFEFEGLPEKGHVALDTMRLEDLPGNRTRLTIQSLFRSVEDRDGMVQAGMEHGMREGYERLVELLEKM